jgi:hypothetical protein
MPLRVLSSAIVKDLDQILDHLKPGKLNAYQYTQDALHRTDVATDVQYQRTYNGIYMLRLPDTRFYAGHYALLQQHKTNPHISFPELLAQLSACTGRLEVSFSSKLLATINPDIPPLDSVVLGHLGLVLPKAGESDRDAKAIAVHGALIEKMTQIAASADFDEIKRRFQLRHPQYQFTASKILDLVLWRYRP